MRIAVVPKKPTYWSTRQFLKAIASRGHEATKVNAADAMVDYAVDKVRR